MKRLHLLLICLAVVCLGATGTRAADFELWPEMSRPPDMWCCLPAAADTDAPGGLVFATESEDAIFGLSVNQTREKDGLTYKALRIFRDYEFVSKPEVPMGRHILLFGYACATGQMDLIDWVSKAINPISVEIDGVVIPLDPSMILLGSPGPGMTGGVYAVFPRFTTPGEHTIITTWQPLEEFYYVRNFEADGIEDPSPEFEGRRVWVPEQVGDPVDGLIVQKRTVIAVENPTAVDCCSWGQIKATLQE